MINANISIIKLNSLTFLVVLLFCITSCQYIDYQLSAREAVGPLSGISIGVNANGVSDDSQIATARALVFNAKGKLVSNTESTVTAGTNDTYNIQALVVKGINHIYIVCNETADLQKSLLEIKHISEIENLTYSDLSTAAPVTMFTKIRDLQIDIDADKKAWAIVNGTKTDVIKASVTRTMAKLSMTVIKNLAAGVPKFAVEALSFKVCRMPRYSNLNEGVKYPKDKGWRPDIKVIGSGTLPLTGDGQYNNDYTIPSGVNSITTPSVYIPEHLPIDKEDPNYCTYLLIEAKCRLEGSSMVMNINYKVDLGTNPPTDNEINRNVHYKIYATIKNLGAMGFYADIVAMDQVSLPVNWKPFEGYVIVSERATEISSNSNVWNDYSQYSGILKISKNKTYNNALFRYGSIVALSDAAAVSDFNSANDLLWQPTVTSPITSWNDVGYIGSGDITEAQHTLDNIKAGKGDPCRLVGLTNDEIAAGIIDNQLWRMPTAAEMAWINTARNDVADPKGFYSFSLLLTPNSGYRLPDGKMTPQSGQGYYWSSTGKESFVFNSATNTGIAASDDAQKAYAIRCMRTTIHPSRFTIHDPQNVGYTGCTDQKIPFLDIYNTPYWKMSVTPPVGDPVGDFTFVKSSGTNKELASMTIKQLPIVYNSRKYDVTAIGYGLDGKVHVVPFSVNQHELVHNIFISLTNPTDLPLVGEYKRLPADGIDLTFAIRIEPTLHPPYDVSMLTAQWRARGSFYDNQPHIALGTEVLINGTSTVHIPANNYGHARAVVVDISPQLFPPYLLFSETGDRELVYIQETN